jgi:pimeloyl-ACP methyl ester carboxylesterase
MQPQALAQQTPVKAGPLPPIVLFLPGIQDAPENTASRVAELLAYDLTLGKGTFAVEAARADSVSGTGLTDHRRIVEVGAGPVLDLATVDYRPKLTLRSVAGTGVWKKLLQVLRAGLYFWRAVRLVRAAGPRAKSKLARRQLRVGFGLTAVLFLGLVIGVIAGLSAVFGWEPWNVPEDVVDAFALGWTAVVVWLLAEARPAVVAACDLIRQAMDYARHADVVADVRLGVREALDSVLEPSRRRPVHLVGYSFGSLVALDFLFPQGSVEPDRDGRYGAIASLTTIGCPVDFVRLYHPGYLADRQTFIRNGEGNEVPFPWQNLFFPADVFGSNFLDDDDYSDTEEAERAGKHTVTIAGHMPTSHRCSDVMLTRSDILARKGFSIHADYWASPGMSHCLGRVTDIVRGTR